MRFAARGSARFESAGAPERLFLEEALREALHVQRMALRFGGVGKKGMGAAGHFR